VENVDEAVNISISQKKFILFLPISNSGRHVNMCLKFTMSKDRIGSKSGYCVRVG
jgi:hypothetical protein